MKELSEEKKNNRLSHTIKAQQPGFSQEMLAGLPKEIEDDIIPAVLGNYLPWSHELPEVCRLKDT